MNNYINSKYELKDKKIIRDLQKAANMYEDGEIAEVRDMLLEIVGAIDDFTDHYNAEV